MTTQHHVTLKAGCSLSQSQLMIEYEVDNPTDSEIGLFNVVLGSQQSGVGTTRPVVAYLDIAEATLFVRKRFIPIPRGLRVTMREVPGITRVGPHQSFAEKLCLDFPLFVYDPYKFLVLEAQARRTQCTTVEVRKSASNLVLEVGFFPIDSGWQLNEVVLGDQRIWRQFPDDLAIAAQQVLSARLVLAGAVEIVDRELIQGGATQG